MADNFTILIHQAPTVASQQAAGLDGVKVAVRIDTVTARHGDNLDRPSQVPPGGFRVSPTNASRDEQLSSLE